MNKAADENRDMVFSKIDQHIIKSLTTLKIMGLFVVLSGVVGILIGIYSTVYRWIMPSESLISLFSSSTAFIGIGWYFYNMTRLVWKLKKHFDSKP